MSMYVRIKQFKTTIFLHCDPIDTVLQLKERINQLLNIPENHQRLYAAVGDDELPNEGTLEDLKIENDAVLYLTRFNEESQTWENINIPQPASEYEDQNEEED
ncbi:hypothetical protein C9374_003437 [Naegleria lovaniensis]|uniref:Ubiquitin-like domain-containing protein n=1 Tax=Naegleria lovaniensis TaxID=51637 RepID=A0AA88GRC5_NAELO|nr:uncharacterized protein C9374_003437 [Naegleria lovaniensis]KAG2385622.1 hypothetical protein C9374_003437 [Naegleria lovaniensis]